MISKLCVCVCVQRGVVWVVMVSIRPRHQPPLGPEHPLHHVSGRSVQEQPEQDGEQQYSDDLEDQVLVVVPEDVTQRLQRVKEPHERSIGTTGEGGRGFNIWWNGRVVMKGG